MTDKRQTLYRHRNEAGDLLYVGVSSRISRRVKEHSQHSPWWLDIARIDLQHFPDREAVLEAERNAIKNEKPKYNIHHKTSIIPEQKAAVEIAKERVLARIVTLKPLYKINEVAGVLGVGTMLVNSEIAAGRLGYLDIQKPKVDKCQRYVSGWQILDWLEQMGAKDDKPVRKAA